MYFEVYKNPTNRQYWFVIKSEGNHKILASSEMYVHKSGAMNAMTIIANGQRVEYFDKTDE